MAAGTSCTNCSISRAVYCRTRCRCSFERSKRPGSSTPKTGPACVCEAFNRIWSRLSPVRSMILLQSTSARVLERTAGRPSARRPVSPLRLPEPWLWHTDRRARLRTCTASYPHIGSGSAGVIRTADRPMRQFSAARPATDPHMMRIKATKKNRTCPLPRWVVNVVDMVNLPGDDLDSSIFPQLPAAVNARERVSRTTASTSSDPVTHHPVSWYNALACARIAGIILSSISRRIAPPRA